KFLQGNGRFRAPLHMRRIGPRFAESELSRSDRFFGAGLVQLDAGHARHTKNNGDNREGKVTLHGPLSGGLPWPRSKVFPNQLSLGRSASPVGNSLSGKAGALPKRGPGKNWTKKVKSRHKRGLTGVPPRHQSVHVRSKYFKKSEKKACQPFQTSLFLTAKPNQTNGETNDKIRTTPIRILPLGSRSRRWASFNDRR